MDTNKTLTQEFLLNVFNYIDGEIYWKTKISRIVKVGKKAGSFDAKGYKEVGIKGKSYKVHRVIYMMFNGYLPKEIDHIDNNKLNNKIVNLRECTHRQNMQNRKLRVDNNSGTTGVSWQDSRKKWLARSSDEKGNRVYLGYYLDYEEAKDAVERFKLEHHKEFARID